MKRLLYAGGAAALMLLLAGCPSQQTVGQLAKVLGNASAEIAALEGDSALSARITTDTAAAVAAIDAWKPGTPADQAVQALNLVVADLNLIPGTSQYAPLIVLAVATAESILAILEPSPAHAAAARAGGTASRTGAPRTAAEFKQQWNAIAAQRGLTHAHI